MEDAHVLASPMAEVPRAHLVAVFDGHRGAAAAQHAAVRLERYVTEAWPQAAGAGDVLARALRRIDAELVTAWQHSNGGGGDASCSGAAALTMLRVGRVLALANLGDCRAVLGRGDEAVALTRDHSAEDDAERAGAEAAGAAVRRGPDGHWRLGAASLAVSRSLGDADAKAEGALSGEPEVTLHEVAPGDDFVIVASDGLWDVLSATHAVALVHDTVKNPAMAAKRLGVEALARGSRDNVTVAVVFLRDVATLESVYRDGVRKYGPVRVAAAAASTRGEVLATRAGGCADDELFERL
jgi:serine/threonine protein phosphatase PrpC